MVSYSSPGANASVLKCVWVCGCVGVWVCGCVGVWVCGCVGVCVLTSQVTSEIGKDIVFLMCSQCVPSDTLTSQVTSEIY
jgi:hypothetical protein